MDAAQRTVLQNNHMELARDIVTTEDFLGICYQQKLFDTNLIEIIRVRFIIHTLLILHINNRNSTNDYFNFGVQ